MKGQLWVVAAPSGGGKTSLIAEAKRQLPRLKESISHTTRPQRKGEIEGVHYFFISQETYNNMRNNGEFLENADVFHHSYATSAAQVDKDIRNGFDVILNIDWQGAEQIRNSRPDVKTVFLLPPSLEALRERLTRRGQDDLEIVEKRMAEAEEQISHYQDFDFLILNDDFQTAANALIGLIKSQRLARSRCAEDYAELIQRLGVND